MDTGRQRRLQTRRIGTFCMLLALVGMPGSTYALVPFGGPIIGNSWTQQWYTGPRTFDEFQWHYYAPDDAGGGALTAPYISDFNVSTNANVDPWVADPTWHALAVSNANIGVARGTGIDGVVGSRHSLQFNVHYSGDPAFNTSFQYVFYNQGVFQDAGRLVWDGDGQTWYLAESYDEVDFNPGSVPDIPEPGTLTMLGLGLIVVGRRLRRRSTSA